MNPLQLGPAVGEDDCLSTRRRNPSGEPRFARLTASSSGPPSSATETGRSTWASSCRYWAAPARVGPNTDAPNMNTTRPSAIVRTHVRIIMSPATDSLDDSDLILTRDADPTRSSPPITPNGSGTSAFQHQPWPKPTTGRDLLSVYFQTERAMSHICVTSRTVMPGPWFPPGLTSGLRLMYRTRRGASNDRHRTSE